jgi:hypothetical protein
LDIWKVNKKVDVVTGMVIMKLHRMNL